MNFVLLLVVGFFALFVPCTASAIDVKTYIPKNAPQYLPIVYREVERLMPNVPTPAYFPGLIEQESCISLTHSTCFSPKAQLLTKRERGAGFGQLTVAYKEDGSVRFDMLQEMRTKYIGELRELSWSNILDRPDLQIDAMVLLIREGYMRLGGVKPGMPRLHMTDAIYNGGYGGFLREQTACGLTKGCDPQLWFDNIERICLKSKKPIYGKRSACDINREHPYNVFKLRIQKYELDYQRRKGVKNDVKS